MKKTIWRAGIAIAALSVVIQLSSIVFWHPLELQQMIGREGPVFIVGLRFENIAAVTLGKVDEWKLSNKATREYGGLHSTTPYFLPFMLKKDGSVSAQVANTLVVGWFLTLAALLTLLIHILRKALGGELEAPPAPLATLEGGLRRLERS